MFKVLLIVYIVGGGPSNGYDYATSFKFQEFESVADCETVRGTLKEMSNAWTYSASKKIIPADYTSKCVKMGAVSPEQETTAGDDVQPIEIEIPAVTDDKRSKRWND